MQKLWIFLLLAGVSLAACSKTEAPSGINDPVFFLSYSLDTPQTVVAGTAGIYHFTDYEETGIEAFSTSHFSQTNCPQGDCPGSLGFEFRSSASIDSAFVGGQYGYVLPDSLRQQPLYYDAWLRWTGTFDVTAFDSLIVDGPAPTVLQSFSAPSQYVHLANGLNRLTLITTPFIAAGARTSVTRWIAPERPDSFPSVGIHVIKQGAQYRLNAEATGGSAPYQYLWSNQDTTLGITLDSMAGGHATVTVTDKNGHAATASVAGLPFPALTSFVVNHFTVETAPVFDQWGRVIVYWIDREGIQWRSDYDRQPPDAFFEVVNSSEYTDHALGGKVTRLNVQFQCLLFNPFGASLPYSGEGYVALLKR